MTDSLVTNALAAALADDRHRAEAAQRKLWNRAVFYVAVGLPVATACEVLGCSRATWYRRTAKERQA